jgi:anthranilate synthase/aminodeoxychorismate synthase-like glutamine amidotransferase
MTARLLLIDNYDSFTYNLVQAFLVLGADVRVYRNDEISVNEALALAPSHLCISPGPGTPHDAGISMEMIRAFSGRVPVLGVCLGHQSIVEVFGGRVVRAPRLMHGKTSAMTHDGRTIFAGLPQPCEVGRYHSLIAAPERMPAELEVSALTAEGEIMGARHRTLMVEGVQFHPESILTPDGPRLLENFLAQSGGERSREAAARAVQAASDVASHVASS